MASMASMAGSPGLSGLGTRSDIEGVSKSMGSASNWVAARFWNFKTSFLMGAKGGYTGEDSAWSANEEAGAGNTATHNRSSLEPWTFHNILHIDMLLAGRPKVVSSKWPCRLQWQNIPQLDAPSWRIREKLQQRRDHQRHLPGLRNCTGCPRWYATGAPGTLQPSTCFGSKRRETRTRHRLDIPN